MVLLVPGELLAAVSLRRTRLVPGKLLAAVSLRRTRFVSAVSLRRTRFVSALVLRRAAFFAATLYSYSGEGLALLPGQFIMQRSATITIIIQSAYRVHTCCTHGAYKVPVRDTPRGEWRKNHTRTASISYDTWYINTYLVRRYEISICTSGTRYTDCIEV